MPYFQKPSNILLEKLKVNGHYFRFFSFAIKETFELEGVPAERVVEVIRLLGKISWN
jgi:hypothetical protein